jgi:hypothetical protein
MKQHCSSLNLPRFPIEFGGFPTPAERLLRSHGTFASVENPVGIFVPDSDTLRLLVGPQRPQSGVVVASRGINAKNVQAKNVPIA